MSKIEKCVIACCQQMSLDAKQMIRETGCDSKASNEKKSDVFANRYKNERMFAVGEIAYLDKGDVGVKLYSSTFTYDVLVTMRNTRDTYDMEKGNRITVIFTAYSAGGCVLPFSGKDGVFATN